MKKNKFNILIFFNFTKKLLTSTFILVQHQKNSGLSQHSKVFEGIVPIGIFQINDKFRSHQKTIP